MLVTVKGGPSKRRPGDRVWLTAPTTAFSPNRVHYTWTGRRSQPPAPPSLPTQEDGESKFHPPKIHSQQSVGFSLLWNIFLLWR